MTNIAHNLAQIQERIAEAALRSGRNPTDVTLVAVAKTFPAEAVVAAYEAGARHVGENRVEEGVNKIAAIRLQITGPQPTWHMVGHIQSRKTKQVAAHFDFVHSVDRLKIARRLSRDAQQVERTLPVLLECNVSGEAAKYGFDLQDWERNAARREAFFATVEEILAEPAISVQGLMTMPPLVADSETVRPIFVSLRALRDALQERFPSADWRHLSMGMTNDFEIAVEEGATMVRIGRAIFGKRERPLGG